MRRNYGFGSNYKQLWNPGSAVGQELSWNIYTS